MHIPRMNSMTVIGLVFAGTLSGCASKYAPPEGAPQAVLVASVEYGGRTTGVVRVQAFANDKCDRTAHGNRLALFVAGTAGPHKNVRIPVVAGKELVFTFSYDGGVPTVTSTTSCGVTMAFTPLPGRTYQADYSMEARACSMRLVELSNDGTRAPVGDMRQIKPVCFNAVDG